MRRIFAFVLAAAVVGPALASVGAKESPTWLLGIWQKTQDEDNSPNDVMKFNADGAWIGYGPKCEEKLFEYFVRNGDVFLIIPLEKGPISLLFRSSTDRKRLTFTSPRTRNNAIYEMVKKPVCGGDG
jgi:hypothetical protein